MNIDQIILYLPQGCSLWNIETSSVQNQYVLVTPEQRFQVSARASDILAELVDEQKTLATLATNLSAKWNAIIMPEDVLSIIESDQWPVGLVKRCYPQELETVLEEQVNEHKQYRSPFGHFFFQCTLLSPERVQKVSAFLKGFYRKPVATGVIALFIAIHCAMYYQLAGPGSWLQLLLLSPGEYVCAFLLMAAGVLFHEFGHASAAARCGIKPGGIGLGLYLIYPALFTELRFAWFLPRLKRVLVDVGGFYFQCIAVVPLYLGFLVSHSRIFVVTIISLDALLIFSLIPFFKFDGYWILSDAIGVPNLQKRALEAVLRPWSILSSKYYQAKSGLTLPRWVAVVLLLFACIFIPFQGLFAFWAIRRGGPVLFAAPGMLLTYGHNLFVEMQAGHAVAAFYVVIRSVMLLVTCLSLLLIYRAYGRLVWKLIFRGAAPKPQKNAPQGELESWSRNLQRQTSLNSTNRLE